MLKFVIKADTEIAKAIRNRSKLVKQQKQIIRNGKAVLTYVWVNPDKDKKKTKPAKMTDKELDQMYFNAIKAGNTELVQKLVQDRAIEKGFKDAIPEQGNGYKIRVTKPPKKTKTYYKCFYVDEKGRPSALFVDNNAYLPTNVWLSANDTYHFEAENGNKYVPTMGNDNNKEAGKTGVQIKIPNETVRQELIERGYLPAGSKAKNITCVAYRPGWHGGDLPFFPQGGRYGNHPLTQNGDENRKYNPDLPESPYKNVHRWNQVIFEIEVDADHDYTEEAKAQPKAWSKTGKFIPDKADLQYMPDGGMYEYTTNPEVEAMTGGKGKWIISGAIKIKRALTEKECNEILASVGMPAQEWEAKPKENQTAKERDAELLNLATMNLSDLGYTGTEKSGARKTLAPITYDDNGEIIPLSQRFNKNSDDIRKSF